MVQRRSPEIYLCAGQLSGFGSAGTTRLTLPLPSLGKYTRRTELNYTPSCTSLSILAGNISIVADCLEVVNEANQIFKGGKASTTGKHADLWLRWEAAAKRNIVAAVKV
eukprot:196586-Heterocapsa_arctica.AAC.1